MGHIEETVRVLNKELIKEIEKHRNAKKPVIYKSDTDEQIERITFKAGTMVEHCPTCNRLLLLSYKYCPDCGQKIEREEWKN